ncbi:hypothetical protein SBRCBS47491_006796 [Sporothrix bragantina]|uniref:Uncharacterized protein n=1 Tax=Sporothrix bragantina TaxID=671064 RepID=A0ABP0C929_9PEZI
MAQLGAFDTGDYGPDAPWWKMHRGHTRSWPHEENDWARMELPSTRRPSAVPSFLRASTAPIGKTAAFPYYNQQPRSNLRRAASHRDLSPRSAAHYFRSTPDSRRSMRSSLSESDGETELTRPTPIEDDEDEDEYNAAGREATESIYVDKHALRDRMDIRKRPSQEYASSSSKQKSSSRQSQKQKQKQKRKEQERSRGRNRGGDFDEEEEQEETSIIQEEDKPPKRSHHRQRSRRSSGSRGGGGGSSRGRRHETVIPEEVVEEQEADADTEMEDDYDDDRRRRRAASRHTRRSNSRHSPATHDRHREMSRSKSRLRHVDSDEFNPRASSRR